MTGPDGHVVIGDWPAPPSTSKTATMVPLTAFRHIIPCSGGKDSSALALYLHTVYPDTPFEVVFADTGAELPETYQFLLDLEVALAIVAGHPVTITRLLSRFGTLENIMTRWGAFLPSPHARWCTRKAKIEPFNEYVGDDPCVVYIGFTADEAERAEKHVYSTKKNLTHVYPFIDAGIEDSPGVLKSFGMELPAYYAWRTRSGCTFCFYQRKAEWMNLLRVHPDEFDNAERVERERAGGEGDIRGTQALLLAA